MSSGDGAPSLVQMTKVSVLKRLQNDLEKETRNATFACGGTIPIITTTATNATASAPADPRESKPELATSISSVVLRFDSQDGGAKLILPAEPGHECLQTLVAACQPATFGRGNESVHDETYRKATKLDPANFSTSFCPYAVGIMDVVTQLLLPGVQVNDTTKKVKGTKFTKTEKVQFSKHRGLRTELYKLNIYSGPSGKFKAHVDTPRSEHQIGSLVVSLPTTFQGGQLIVGHKDNEITFDWSSSATSNAVVNWAAFYSDCIHEVKEVTSGHRITLTYNLFVSRGTGMLAGIAPNLTRSQLPLYDSLKKSLASPIFLRKGALMGFYLAHAYLHTHRTLHKTLPAALKGSDMVLYECVRALGLKCSLVPVAQGFNDHFKDEIGGYEDVFEEELSSDESFFTEDDYFDSDGEYQELADEETGWQDDEEEDGITDEQRKERSSVNKAIEAKINKAVDKARKAHEEEQQKSRKRRDKRHARKAEIEAELDQFRTGSVTYGSGLEATQSGGRGMSDDYGDMESWGTVLRNALWITKPKHKEIQKAYVAYGNEPSLGADYTSAALLVSIPAFDKRN